MTASGGSRQRREAAGQGTCATDRVETNVRVRSRPCRACLSCLDDGTNVGKSLISRDPMWRTCETQGRWR
eukprot:946503-Pleurochrysis_carterae.AAC.2